MKKVMIVAAIAASIVSISAISNQASAAISTGSIASLEEIQKVNGGAFQVAWSIKGAAKKVGKAAKSVGKKAGKAVGKVNRVVVPSEIRNGASKVANGAYKAGRFIAKHPYGRRCKPDKYLRPVCTVKGTGPTTRDHRTQRKNTIVPARYGRRSGRIVRDHRKSKAVSVIRDHRTNR